MIEELGMSNLLIKHSLRDSNVKIEGIDGGIDSCNEPDDNSDNDDSDEDSEEGNVKEQVREKVSEESHDVLEECSANDVEQIAIDIRR